MILFTYLCSKICLLLNTPAPVGTTLRCRGNNPGPCGAGAIVFVEEETTELNQSVCKRGSILLGELIAIKIVLEYIR